MAVRVGDTGRAASRGLRRLASPAGLRGVGTELAEPAPGCRTRFLAVWSDLDQLIYPKTSARIEHPDLVADNVLVPGLGHMSLPAAAQVARTVSRALAHLDPDGTPADIKGTRPDIDCA